MPEIEFLVQAGAVGISIGLILLIRFLVKFMFKEIRKDREDFKNVITNHMGHQTKAMENHTRVVDKLTTAIESLDRRLNGKR